MDGHALCAAVRADPETAFIPIILLTARAEQREVVQGLEGGADDYLTKPFDVRELRARIRNIIAARKRFADRLNAGETPPPSAPGSGAPALLERVHAVLARHIAREDLDVDMLARALAMSRATLYRRLQDVIDCTPMELIWRYRLERASTWLATTDGSVAEIAYAAGFKSVPHFSGRFRQYFGCTPTAWRTRSRAEAAPHEATPNDQASRAWSVPAG
jgi:AraC-like DNA-binding protein